MDVYGQALILGAVEAATEFLPVSSTGHLILAAKLLGAEGLADGVFEVVIQLGAILAIVALYFARLWRVLVGLPTEQRARAFALYVLLAFVPSAVLGLLLHDYIKAVLFDPIVVCWALMVGGVAILAAEAFAPKVRVREVETMGWRTAVGIGLGQCLAMIPGVSRSGATILSAVSLGVERKTAAEFSFFLAIPTMFGATALDLWKARDVLTMDGMEVLAVGFVTSFVLAIPIVKWLVGFVGRNGFGAFAWYRIAVGIFGLWVLGAL